MQNLSEIVKVWPVIRGWSVAPEDFPFCKKGTRLLVQGDDATIGNGVKIGNDATIGNYATIGDYAMDSVNLGFANGFAVHLAQVDGVAFIGGGCKWFNISEAVAYVIDRPERAEMLDRVLYAATIADRKGWRRS